MFNLRKIIANLNTNTKLGPAPVLPIPNFLAKQFLNKLSIAGAVLGARLIKFSWLVGSQISFFSAINIVAPMAGILGGLSGALVALSTKLIWGLITGAGCLGLVLGYLPHLLASYYWCTKFKLFRIIYPLACIVTFITGTNLIYGTGASAGLYSCLWLIPAIIGALNTSNRFLLALGSTFCAHATGSLIWLATVNMTNLQWVSLIPIALTERLLFASGMYAVYAVAVWFDTFCYAEHSRLRSGFTPEQHSMSKGYDGQAPRTYWKVHSQGILRALKTSIFKSESLSA